MKKWIVLIFILLISGFIFFYKLAEIPSGFYVDEATIAYNARSISQTGKDEFGFSHPLYFRLLGSYSPGLFVYLASIAINFFGSSPVLFRSISAVAAILSIFFFYLLLRKMKPYKFELTYFAVVFFYSISPWVVFNARLGYETTLGFLLFNIGAYFLFSALTNRKFLSWGVLFLSISTYASHNQRFLAPLFLFIFLIVFKDIFLKKENRRNLIGPFILGLVSQIPNLLLIDTRAFWIKNNQFDIKYFWNFLMYLSPKTIFFENPDIDLQRTIPKLSIMYDWMTIPYLIGIYLFVKRIKEINFKFLAVFGAVSIIPAVFSGYFLSMQRFLPFAFPLSITVGLGIDEITKRVGKRIVITALTVLAFYSLLLLYGSYFVLFPKERANAWNYGYEQIASYISQRPNNKFLIDDTRNPRAYILLLYFLNIPPEEYQKELGSYYKDNYYKAPDPAHNYYFSNVEVREINWEEDPKKDLVIIGDALSVSDNQAKEHKLTEIGQLRDPLGNTIFKIYKTHPQKS